MPVFPTPPLTPERLAGLRETAVGDPALRLATNAVTATEVDKVTLNHAAVTALNPTTEAKLDTLGVTDQKQSGRCWMFAGLNVFRHRIAEKLNVADFEFSEAYLQFYDKLEKSNHVLRSLDALFRSGVTDADDRTVQSLLAAPAHDGGQWNYLVNLISRYGVVPKYVMPETYASDRTPQLDKRLSTVLRRGAVALRSAAASGQDTAPLLDAALADAHRVIATHLGLPPTEFVWQYRDKDGDFHRVGTRTPQEFAAEVLTDELTGGLDNYVSVVNDPREENPYGRAYAVRYETNVWDTPDFSYVNAGIAELKRLAKASIDAGDPVWFACDVNRQFASSLGVWDAHLYERDALYGTDTATTKAEQMRTRESMLTHGMVLTGYDEESAATTTWRVENSWGTKSHGEHTDLGAAGAMKGYGTMADSWFDDNVFQVVVHRKYLSDDRGELPGLADLDRGEITVLPIWDAMA
jgi:bleomycin hydrolase